MIKNYLKVAWRNLVKNKVFSLINIAGLGAGLACFLLIVLYVADELSYDRYNKKADRIYRVNGDIRFGGNDLHLAVSSDPMGPTLKKDYPQVEEYVRFYASGPKLVRKGTQFISEHRVVHVDSTLFDVFTLPAIAGDTHTALNEPNSVVITRSCAMKYFGSTDVVGKTIETNDDGKTDYKVTAVIKDVPHNSHFNFDFFFSMDNVRYQWGSFLSNNFQTYVLLRPGTDYREFDKNLKKVVSTYVVSEAKQYMNINSIEDFEKAGNKLVYTLMPLTDIHLHSDRFPELGVNGNIQYVYIFSAVALFVLLLACVNFMNLSTARSSGRAREVGIRKVLGTERKSLVFQFLAESTLMTAISMIIAMLIVAACLSYFNNLSGKNLSLADFVHPGFIVFLLLLPVVVGLLAGGYPAFFLSSFRPISVLKGKLQGGVRRSVLRNVLVVFQFATSIILIAGTIIVYRQLNYIQTKKLGFNKDQLLVINSTYALGNNTDAFRNEVAKMPGILASTYAGFLPVANSSRSDNSYSKEAVMDSKNGINMQTWEIDYDYVPTLGMEMVRGRNFSREFGTDSNALIINETTAQLLGFDNPVGRKLYTMFQDHSSTRLISYDIIGVVKNFNYESLRQNIGPLCFRLGKPSWVTAFKVNTANIRDLVAGIESKWKTMASGMPFSYQFMDEAFDDMYRVEQRTGKLGMSLTLVAIVIACLGLFGLATYMAEQRVKEIGVRKVLGASVASIVKMLSGSFLRLVLFAIVLAVPLSWWAMNRWLQDFAYRIHVAWWVFAVAGLGAILIAFITVSFQAIKAALANPVESLRNE